MKPPNRGVVSAGGGGGGWAFSGSFREDGKEEAVPGEARGGEPILSLVACGLG